MTALQVVRSGHPPYRCFWRLTLRPGIEIGMPLSNIDDAYTVLEALVEPAPNEYPSTDAALHSHSFPATSTPLPEQGEVFQEVVTKDESVLMKKERVRQSRRGRRRNAIDRRKQLLAKSNAQIPGALFTFATVG